MENHAILGEADEPAVIFPRHDDSNISIHRLANQTTDLHVISPFYTYNIASNGVIVNGLFVKEMSRKIVDELEVMARLGSHFCFTLAHP